MTRRQELFHQMRCALVGSDGWCAVPDSYGLTVRWSETLPTPSYIRESYRGDRAPYPFPEYDRHVFVTLVGGQQTYRTLLRVARCPWVQAQRADVSMFRALAILDQPESVFVQVD